MSKPFTPKVVTGNALIEGDVIYLTQTGGWTRRLEEAAVFTDAQTADAKLAEAEARPAEIVGAYLADVTVEEDRPAPTHFREAFRQSGPSNYFHGKQAELS